MGDLREDDDDLGREPLPDDDPELAAFFAGEDLAADPVPDGGKPAGCQDCG